jgi:hypothetical protein
MLSGPCYITNINNGIRFIAGYTEDDGMQHVIAAGEDGYVYHAYWYPSELPFVAVQPLGEQVHFGNGMLTIAGFFTSDDQNHHAVVGTSDGILHEFYYKLSELPHVPPGTDLPYSISGFDPKRGMASFYSPSDRLRHVVIVDSMGKPEDITWITARYPDHHPIPIPFQGSQIASISGFISKDENPNTRHIIVARNDTAQIYDIDYPGHVPSTVGQNYVRTSFSESVLNVTAFFSSDINYRHIVVLNKKNGNIWLQDHAYDTYGGNLRSTQLTSPALADVLANVADITSFYNDHDHLCHVFFATNRGSLFEITYTSQG